MRNLKHSILLLLLLLSVLSLGCGGDGDDPVTPPGQSTDLGRVELTIKSTPPMARIYVSGIPGAKAEVSYEVVFLDPEGMDHFSLPLEVPTEGLPWFMAPFHPELPNEGGPIRLLIAAGEDRSPELDLDLGALPAAPGSFARFVSVLGEHIDQRAVLEGSSFAELAGQDFADVEPRLLPFKFAQAFVDDPNNPNCLARIADGSSDYLDAEAKDLLDRIFGYAPVDSVVQADIDHLTGAETSAFTWYGDDASKDGCVNMGPTVSTAPQLSDAMQTAFEAKIATDPNGAPAQILGATGLALGAAAFVPGLGGVAAVAGAGLYAFQTSREYYANTYPSAFVSLDFALDKSELSEDEPGFARWSDVNVIAKSNGWVADKAIFDAIMQLAGAGLGAAQLGKIKGSETLRDAAMTDVGMSVGFFLGGQPSGLVEFCSQRWKVDITDLPYSKGQAVIGRVTVDTKWREIRPAQVGTDIIRVKAVSEQFGYQTISADLPIETKAIKVTAVPSVVFVKKPGEIVNITATLQYAELETMDWRPEEGSWNDGMGNSTNEPGTRPLLTPTDEKKYPFLVVVESLSRQGLRAAGDPPRLDIVTVKHEKATITVSPNGICVANGETQIFTATVEGLDNTAVTWSLEPVTAGGVVVGSINETTGVYKAPTSGGSEEVLVVATSQEDPEVVGKALVETGSCACSWSLTIEGEGSWSGDFAGHLFATQFGPFTMTFGQLDPDADGLGTVQIFEEVGPTTGVTGSWGCNFGWLIGERGWFAINDEDSPSILEVLSNSGAKMKSTISGTVYTPVNGDIVYKSFHLNIRSGDISTDGAVCGEG